MARPLRIEYEGAFYQITARGNERKKIYFAGSDYEKFKTYLKEAQEKFAFLLHCYVLMTNHAAHREPSWEHEQGDALNERLLYKFHKQKKKKNWTSFSRKIQSHPHCEMKR